MAPSSTVRTLLAACFALVLAAAAAPALAQDEDQGRMEIYGFAMLDMGYENGQSDPDWFDVMRPTKLPTFEDEFGGDGHFFAGVRQSRLGFKAWMPTSKGEIKTIFEFELFGVGVDAGQTTFRLRHAYGEFNHWGAGQTWSPFMDPDVFPNSIEYWGPNGMVFFRNVQVRWMPLMGDNELMFALERPGASGDPGVLVGSPGVDLVGRFPLPDVSGHYKMTRGWGHVQIAGILRRMEWDDTDPLPPDLSGDATGWGINLSSNLKFDKDTLRLQFAYGEGIANYMNDATSDVGALAPGDPDVGEALPLIGIVAFYDKTWSDKFTSSFGYSMLSIDNSDGQTADAFHKGQYALANLLYYPVKGLMWGGELQWGDRTNNDDGGLDADGNLVESFDDWRVQFSVKYNFAKMLGGK